MALGERHMFLIMAFRVLQGLTSACLSSPIWSLHPCSISLFPNCPPPSLSWSFPLLEAHFPWCLMWPGSAHSSGLSFHVSFLKVVFSGHPIFSRFPYLCADSVCICFLHSLLLVRLGHFTLLLMDSLSVWLRHLIELREGGRHVSFYSSPFFQCLVEGLTLSMPLLPLREVESTEKQTSNTNSANRHWKWSHWPI